MSNNAINGTLLRPTFVNVVENASYDDILADPETWKERLYTAKVLVLRGLPGLTKDQLWDLHCAFGTPWTIKDYRDSYELASWDTPGKHVTTYSNVLSEGRIGDKALPWHHDIPWHREKRYPIRSLYPTKLDAAASSITTDFCDCDRIWSRLSKERWPEMMAADIRLQFWYFACRSLENPGTRVVPLVEQHPHTKKWSLLLNSFGPSENGMPFSTTYTGAWIVDCWSKSRRMGLRYLNELHELVCTEDNIYRHSWELGDLILFDNYSGVFHSRSRITQANVNREFWRMNLRHYWQT
jgi:alpha-ketoglutarate-dependent taurine dioxygenase